MTKASSMTIVLIQRNKTKVCWKYLSKDRKNKNLISLKNLVLAKLVRNKRSKGRIFTNYAALSSRTSTVLYQTKTYGTK